MNYWPGRKKKRVCMDRWPCPIAQDPNEKRRHLLAMTLEDYIQLIDWTGRQIKYGHKGAIPDHLAPIMDRLQIDSSRWLNTVSAYGSLFRRVAGRLDSMLKAAQSTGRGGFAAQKPVGWLFTSSLSLNNRLS